MCYGFDHCLGVPGESDACDACLDLPGGLPCLVDLVGWPEDTPEPRAWRAEVDGVIPVTAVLDYRHDQLGARLVTIQTTVGRMTTYPEYVTLEPAAPLLRRRICK